MKKISIFVVVILTVILLCLCGCTLVNSPKSNIEDDRFELIYHSVNIKNVSIIVDTETNVQYICADGGLTVLVDECGKPLLYEGEVK